MIIYAVGGDFPMGGEAILEGGGIDPGRNHVLAILICVSPFLFLSWPGSVQNPRAVVWSVLILRLSILCPLQSQFVILGVFLQVGASSRGEGSLPGGEMAWD